VGSEARESAALARKPDVWEWLDRLEKIEDRVSGWIDPAARRLFALAVFTGVWTYWMPDFVALEEYLGPSVVIPIFFYYGAGVGGLSWGLWHLFRERFPWDD